MQINPMEILKAAHRYQSVGTGKTSRTTTGTELIVSARGDGEAAERHRKKMNRLSRTASEERARRCAAEASLSGRATRTQKEVIGSLGQERIIGARDLLDISFVELAIALARGVGRIRLSNGFGTGFLVGPRLLMTNNHVIASPQDARGAVLQLDYQESSKGELLPVQAFRLDPDLFFLTSPELDFTITGVQSVSAKGLALAQYPWAQLISETGKAEVGDPLNIVQHPRGELKQIAFRNNTVLAMPPEAKSFLHYTTDTEPGSSGSPCFNDQWDLVALHHSGVPRTEGDNILKKDGTPWRQGIDDPGQIDWIANEGIRVSALVSALRAASLNPAARDLVAQMLEQEPPNPIELARASGNGGNVAAAGIVSSAGAITNGAPQNGTVTWTIPLQVSVSIGGLAAAAAGTGTTVETPLTAGTGAADEEEAITIDQNFKARKGYDPDFLGVKVELPRLNAAMQKDTLEVPAEFRRNGQKHILHYHNFSLAFNKARRMAWFSACMVDGDRRPKITRGKDKWFFDPRIDRKFQAGEEVYIDKAIDRGHVTRREDAAWGDTLKAAINANNDTFHFTNASPQLSAFNQGQDRWQGLENFLLEKAKKEKRRLVVITGPVFARSDPLYRNAQMTFSLRVPLQFWKVCVLVRKDDTVSATAFLLGQEEIAELPGFGEKFNAAVAQITIKDLEQRTGLGFGSLSQHDHLGEGGKPGTLEVVREFRSFRIKPIEDYDDIVL